MRVLVVLTASCIISAGAVLLAETPSTMPTTTPATRPARQLGIMLVDENRNGGGQEAIQMFGGNLVVNAVKPGSRADTMGLKEGDAIKRINDKDMNTVQDVQAVVRDAERLKIEVIREQVPLTLEETSGNQ